MKAPRTSQILLVSLVLVVLCLKGSLTQNTPRENRLLLGLCLQTCIEHLYKANEIPKNQSAPEFLGTFCIQLSVNEVIRRFNKYIKQTTAINPAQQNVENRPQDNVAENNLEDDDDGKYDVEDPEKNISNAIKDCLKEYNKEPVFSRYLAQGMKILQQQRDQFEKLAKKSTLTASTEPQEINTANQHQNETLMLPAPPIAEQSPESSNWAIVPVQNLEPHKEHQQTGTTNQQQNEILMLPAPPTAEQPPRSNDWAIVSVQNPGPNESTSNIIQHESPAIVEQPSWADNWAIVPVQNPDPSGSTSNIIQHELKPEHEEADYVPDPKTLNQFIVFHEGLCNFVEAEDPRETLKCCKDCIENLIYSIQCILLASIKLLNAEQKKTADLQDDNYYLSEEYKNDYKATQVENIKNLGKTAKTILESLNDVYKNFNKIDLPENFKNMMNENLSDSYFDYESCIQWACAVRTGYQIPLHRWLEKKVSTSEVVEPNLFQALLQVSKLRPEPSKTLKEPQNEGDKLWMLLYGQ